MSYEGYVQYLCEKGHQSSQDCYMDDLKECPICKAKIVWENHVNVTNGSFDERGKRIDNYKELKVKSIKVCKHCGSVLETIYKIPKTRR